MFANKVVERVFSFIDENKDGKLDYDEFCKCLKYLRFPYPKQDFRQIFNKVDLNHSGFVELVEFKKFVAKQSYKVINFITIFRMMDYLNDGLIDFYEFKSVSEYLGWKGEVLKNFKKLDLNGDGFLEPFEAFQYFK